VTAATNFFSELKDKEAINFNCKFTDSLCLFSELGLRETKVSGIPNVI